MVCVYSGSATAVSVIAGSDVKVTIEVELVRYDYGQEKLRKEKG